MTPIHPTCYPSADLGQFAGHRGIWHREGQLLCRGGFLLILAKLGWAQHPTRTGGLALRHLALVAVSGQPQKHVTALVALLRMNGVLFR